MRTVSRVDDQFIKVVLVIAIDGVVGNVIFPDDESGDNTNNLSDNTALVALPTTTTTIMTVMATFFIALAVAVAIVIVTAATVVGNYVNLL